MSLKDYLVSFSMNYLQISTIFYLKHHPPYFIGSQIRGAFGYTLKKVTCINPSYSCDDCFAQTNCLYFDFYEKKNIFHNYRLDFELGKDFYEFSIFLFEEACEKLPYVLSALQLLLTQNGLGKTREKPKEFSLFINGEDIFKNGKIVMPKNPTKTFTIDRFSKDITLEFITPLRIKKQNRFIDKNQLELQDIINSIYQRQMKILQKGYRKFPYKIQGKIKEKDLFFKELTRYSNRQKTKMKLGGIVGEMRIAGLSQESYNILKVGELIGAGKQTVFGLGKIKLKEHV